MKSDTMLGWDRQLVAETFAGSPQREALGRPTTDAEDDPERAQCDHGGLGLFALWAVVDP